MNFAKRPRSLDTKLKFAAGVMMVVTALTVIVEAQSVYYSPYICVVGTVGMTRCTAKSDCPASNTSEYPSAVYCNRTDPPGACLGPVEYGCLSFDNDSCGLQLLCATGFAPPGEPIACNTITRCERFETP